jgi:hypothetical protein
MKPAQACHVATVGFLLVIGCACHKNPGVWWSPYPGVSNYDIGGDAGDLDKFTGAFRCQAAFMWAGWIQQEHSDFLEFQQSSEYQQVPAEDRVALERYFLPATPDTVVVRVRYWGNPG